MHGERGLGQLTGKEATEAVRILLEAAKQEAETEDGAFLGAMLKVRMGNALQDHVLTLLQHLEKHRIHEHGITLLDAFAYIVAMHAENQMYLSQQVLSEVLSFPPHDLRRKIIHPLGMEAAASGAGGFIYSRHRTIAKTAKKQLIDVFGYDFDELYVEMAGAAIAMRVRGEFVPNLHDWDYNLPQYFLNNGKKSFAISIAKRICEKDPQNTLRLTNLTKIYRDAGEPQLAIQVFRDSFGTVSADRPFYHDWGTTEGITGNQPLSALLEAFSLADQAEHSPPDNKRAKLSMNRFGDACKGLFGEYHDRLFLTARGAVAQMALHLALDAQSQQNFERHLQESRAEGFQDMDIDAAMRVFQKAAKAAWLLCGGKNGELSGRLMTPDAITFDGLSTLIQNAAKRKQVKNKNG